MSDSAETPPPTSAESVRRLVSACRLGSLGTQSQQHSGFPFVSLMPYALDRRGSPIFFVSSMAVHSRNIARESRVSLLVADDLQVDPLNSQRVTLLGTVQPAAGEAVSPAYLARHENARQWRDFSDFSYFRLEVEAAYYIRGFGSMCWITGADYYRACPTT